MKILLVDDHPLILSALQSVIQGLRPDVTVVTAGSARAARQTLKADADFDLVMLDLQLGDADGFDVLDEFRSTYPALPVVVVSASDRQSDVIRAVDAGAMGFVPKRSSNEALYEALQVVMTGGIYIPTMAMGSERPSPPAEGDAVQEALGVVHNNARPEEMQTQPPMASLGLTPRQTEVLALLLQGKPNKLIARDLNVSVETVKDHVAAVLRALGVSSRTQAVLAVGQMSKQGGLNAWRTPLAADIASTSAAPLASAQTVETAADASAPGLQARLALAALPEEVQTTYDFLAIALAGYVAGVGVVIMLFWQHMPASVLLPWAGAFAVMGTARWLVGARFKRSAPQSHADWLRWQLYSNIGTVAAGALWGLTGWVFYVSGNALQQTGLTVLIYTFVVAAVPVLSTQPRMFLGFVSLCFLPLVVRVASVGTIHGYQLAGELLLIIGLTGVLARYHRQALRRIIELKLQADGLLSQLRVEKQAAEAARREAEVANRAKTQFFTAASHDLRQPLHAMGLFAEALRQRVHEPEMAHLVNSINESVDALEGLFSELLDITRIDSGGVEVHPRHFQIDDILRKLRLHFEPIAFEKGLSLRLRGGKRAVLADPLLVERVLRNLVSNAIRYTHDGTVLVGCRQRGDKVLLQVWDSGQGIPVEQQAMIFEEFYQVPGTAVVEPHQRKGLGLGLAIVKRLAGLMGAPLRLVSTPGRGSVFSLELPSGKAPGSQAVPQSSKGPLELTLNGRLIVIVEDEPVVRTSLEVLLKGWGASIVSFDSVGSSAEWARTCPTDEPAPHLLIVDYRLENGLNGVQAILALRERFGAGVPAIVVTGSTMTGHEREAQEHDFHVLTKPVLPNKLRAMIAFKLGVKQASKG